MPIVVRYEPAANVVGRVAYLGGAGRRQAEDYNRMVQQANAFYERLDRQREAAMRFQLAQMGLAAEQQRFNAQMQQRAQMAAQDWQERAAMQQREFEFRGIEANQQDERERAQWEFRLTREQEIENERINKAMQEIQASQAYTPEEKEELFRQLEARRWGVQPMPVPVRPQKPLDEQFKEEVTYIDDPNRPGMKLPVSRGRNGGFQVLQGYDPPAPESEKAKGAPSPQADPYSPETVKSQVDYGKTLVDAAIAMKEAEEAGAKPGETPKPIDYYMGKAKELLGPSPREAAWKAQVVPKTEEQAAELRRRIAILEQQKKPGWEREVKLLRGLISEGGFP